MHKRNLITMSTAELYALLADLRSEDWWSAEIDAVEFEISERLGAELLAELGMEMVA